MCFWNVCQCAEVSLSHEFAQFEREVKVYHLICYSLDTAMPHEDERPCIDINIVNKHQSPIHQHIATCPLDKKLQLFQ